MLPKEQLGLFWGQDAFCFVETKKGQAVKTVTMPFDTPLDTDHDQDVPEGLKLTALIQKALQEHGITSKKINLALPAKDLMFRSFVIPWMNSEEVRNVVDFEITKYIPIPLSELVYTYHPLAFTENNQKKLRILFVAIRKGILERYAGILEHTNLQVEHIEPSSVSLVRLLQKQKHISSNHSNAIIEIQKGGGKVVITENDVVHFVREFQTPDAPVNEASLTAKLFNDIRVSLNFYTRQSQQQLKIHKIIILALTHLDELEKDLSSEFKIPTSSIIAEKVLKTDSIADIGLLSAYGVALKDKASSTKDFGLFGRSKRSQTAEGGAPAPALNYKAMAGTLAACALIIFLASFLTDKMVAGLKKRQADLQAKEGIFQESDISQIEKMKKEVSEKLSSYKDVRIKSDVSFYLTKIPQLLPDGMWLSNLDVRYRDMVLKEKKAAQNVSGITVTFDGYAYLEDTNDQFRLVNQMVTQLKEEDDFASSFSTIDLVSVRQENLNNYPVTYFQIACK